MVEAMPPVVCRACGRKVKMEQVQYDPVQKGYVCSSCHAKAHPSLPPLSKTKPAGAAKPSIFAKTGSAKEEVIKYACHECKYRFTKKKDKPATKCPYCGGTKFEEVTNDAAKILEDSDKYNF
jgi:DNA-directed RNA polymerase subunit RPC12/RpoP